MPRPKKHIEPVKQEEATTSYEPMVSFKNCTGRVAEIQLPDGSNVRVPANDFIAVTESDAPFMRERLKTKGTWIAL